MKLCNDTITVFNAVFDPEKDRDLYIGTVISDVSWYADIVTSVTDTGLKAASKYVVRIPFPAIASKSYIDRNTFEVQNVDSVIRSYFTLKPGDIIIKGEVGGAVARRGGALQYSIDGPSIIVRSVKDLDVYAERFTVLSVTDNRRAPHGAHWKVVGA